MQRVCFDHHRNDFVQVADRPATLCGASACAALWKPWKAESVWIWLMSILLCLVYLEDASAMQSGSTQGGRNADGELHACQAVSVDQAWAVGDRGLILATADAGKTWTTQNQRLDMNLYALHFANTQQGLTVGGTINKHTGRSSGVAFWTADGGGTWQSSTTKLPRLIGLQFLGPNHFLAWGDWSNLYQSSLFESLDGGKTWASRPVPCSHIQAAAADATGKVMVVDRTGRGYRSDDGIHFKPISLPLSPFAPVRFCKFVEGMWWFGGDAGQLYRSADGVAWTKCNLPGNASDQTCYSLRDMTVIGKRAWVVGNPGNVVWTSEDQGDSWSVRKMESPTMNRSISAFNADVLLTCGSFASIRTSRNGGKAWWTLHQSGSRSSVLNVASTVSSVAWDLVAHVALDLKRTTSVVVIHDQLFETRMGLNPDLTSRIDCSGALIGVSAVRVMPQFPVGNMLSGSRESDINYYAARNDTETEQANSAMLRALVLELRTLRPDVLVTDCSESGTELERLSSNAVDAAVRLSADENFRLFSDASGVSEEAWQPQRTIVRGTRAGLVYSEAMLLKSSGIALGQILSSVRQILHLGASPNDPSVRIAYRFLGSKSGSMRDPLEGVLTDPATQLNERTKPSVRLSNLMATCQLYDTKQMFATESSSQFTTDRVWESKIKGLAKDAMPESVAPALLQIAVQSRREGDWQQWHTALELALSMAPTQDAAEPILVELMTFLGSAEVQQIVANQIQIFEQQLSQDKTNNISNVLQASPFARSEFEEEPVQTVSFQSAVKRVPIATNRSLNEFTRLLARWPSELQERRAEPRWGWLITSRYRSMQKNQDGSGPAVNLERSSSNFWPLLAPHLLAWNQVAEAERAILKSQESPELRSDPTPNSKSQTTNLNLPGIMKCNWTDHRPFLDGKDDEALWEAATFLELRDPWVPSQDSFTTLRLSRDDEFLYLFSRSPITDKKGRKVAPDQNAVVYSKITDQIQKPFDNVRNSSDQVRIRIDIDRDYATWFEFAWSATGEKTEACNDMTFWNPTWFVATLQEENSWTTEIAIPLSELVGNYSPTDKEPKADVWAINAIRSIPSTGTHTIDQSISDRLSDEEWLFINMSR